MEIEKLKQKILDLAIRGKLVPQDPNDEPASVLIDRIRAEKEELIKQGKIKRSKEDSYIYKGSDNCYYEKVGDNETKIDFKEPITTSGCIWMQGYQIFKPMQSIGKICGETIDYIDIDAIDNKENKIKCAKNILSKNAPSRAKRKVENGSTLFSMVRPYLRNIAYIEEQYEHCVASTGFYVCTPQFFIVPKYLYYLMISPYVVNGINFYMKGDNSPSVRSEQIESFLFPIPSLERQRKIAKFLDTVFNKIDLLKNDISQLNSSITQLKIKILDDIFGENSRYKSYYTHYGKLGDFGKLISGRDLKHDEYNDNNNGVPYLTGASNFENETVIINRWTPVPVVLSLENDVLITCKGTIGKTAINKIKKCHIARQIMAFRCNEKVLPEFLKLYFEYMTTTLQKASSSLIPGITRSIMLSLNIAFPPIEKQQEIIENTQKIMLILESIIS